MRKKVA